ncbi:hypothetical protein HDU97_000397 [Phlyctochytrium planicorne]|nr:hypothetical protein HDU97_000397 [Phlyctochytrium planicorne]
MADPTSSSPSSAIPDGQGDDLRGLVVSMTNQADLERKVEQKLLDDMKKKDDLDDQKRLAKTADTVKKVMSEIETLKLALEKPALRVSQKEALRDRIKRAERNLAMLRHEEGEILDRMKKRERAASRRKDWSVGNAVVRPNQGSSGLRRRGSAGKDILSGDLAPPAKITEPASLTEADADEEETEREFLIRTGKITPFAAVAGLERNFAENLPIHEEDGGGDRRISDLTEENRRTEQAELETSRSAGKRRLRRFNEPKEKKQKKRKRNSDSDEDYDDGDHDSDADYVPSGSDAEDNRFDSDENVNKGGDESSESEDEVKGSFDRTRKVTKDDGDEIFYQRRLRKWLRLRRLSRMKGTLPEDFDEDLDEQLYADPHLEPIQPMKGDVTFEGGLTVPGDVWGKLFGYQKTCVRWLWELHCQKVGGIIGDEMGLGKTVQIIAFLAALSRSSLLTQPILVICPATVLRQWCNEFLAWWPYFRVAILHSSGSGLGSSANLGEEDEDDDLSFDKVESKREREEMEKATSKGKGKRKAPKKAKGVPREASAKTLKQVGTLVKRIVEQGHIVLTTYEGLRVHRRKLLPVQWAYCVLDEGHKIRNADADITLTCKQVKTPNRIILSGTPIQNNLKELWSLYDFVYPGRLGTLPVFVTQFEVPIRIGAYSNASLLQVQTALRCATVLRGLISPYLLRRMKMDVASDLPKKSEQVLFCKLSDEQRLLYERYLNSRECRQILDGNRNALGGIDYLRKVCNHPDLTKLAQEHEIPDFGSTNRSGKLMVVKALLSSWSKQGHRTLVFCQTKQMLNIVEKMVDEEGYKYMRMDGSTSIRTRIGMVDGFNRDKSIPVFLLTTRVGGLGINLTGANRVIIFDPDWNPSTDVQARERAWRLGQTREVVVYRLMMSGTIEEKIYHRQIYKQFLTNQILQRDATSAGKSKRFFDSRSLFDLFCLGDPAENGGTETGNLFKGAERLLKDKKRMGAGREAKSDRKEEESRKIEVHDQIDEIDAVDKIEEYQGEGGNKKPEEDMDVKDEAAGSPSSKKDKKRKKSEVEEDDRILSMLVQSTIAHDRVMEGGGKEDDQIAREADKVAEEAARELKRSRQMVRMEQRRAAERDGGNYAGVITWTGSSGSAGSAPLPRYEEPTRRSILENSLGFGGGSGSRIGAVRSPDLVSPTSARPSSSGSGSRNVAPSSGSRAPPSESTSSRTGAGPSALYSSSRPAGAGGRVGGGLSSSSILSGLRGGNK